jgi:hypothetical protein
MVEIAHLEIETPFGRLRGTKSESVAAFRRVPYAQAPVGPRRFAMPGPAPRWSGVRDATLPGSIPPQLPSRLDAVNGVYQAEQNEDCLHLDIWTRHSAGDLAPVLVFIHGGAFMTGRRVISLLRRRDPGEGKRSRRCQYFLSAWPARLLAAARLRRAQFRLARSDRGPAVDQRGYRLFWRGSRANHHRGAIRGSVEYCRDARR